MKNGGMAGSIGEEGAQRNCMPIRSHHMHTRWKGRSRIIYPTRRMVDLNKVEKITNIGSRIIM